MGESVGWTQVKHVAQHELLQEVQGTAWYKRGAASSPNFKLTNQSTKYRDFRVQGVGDWRLGEIANPTDSDTD